MPDLFGELKLRGTIVPNRIAVSPMAQYCAIDGHPTDWHFVHLGSRAVGGAGIVFTEATAVLPEARITPYHIGLWNDAHIESLQRVVRFIHSQNSVAAIQLVHAGRKGSARHPSEGASALPPGEGGWQPVAPSEIAFGEGYSVPSELSEEGVRDVVNAFARAAVRAAAADYRIIELHAAHGYLLHQFLSPLSNRRNDQYGGSFGNRIRLLCEVVGAVRQVLPENLPLLVRISATDWMEGGWTLDESIELARRLESLGVDMIDCSSGGTSPSAKITLGPGYQTAFAERIKREAGILTGTVGMITSPAQADHIIRTGQADIVLLGREFLRDPYWPLRAARELGRKVPWPVQYIRAAPQDSPAAVIPPHSR